MTLWGAFAGPHHVTVTTNREADGYKMKEHVSRWFVNGPRSRAPFPRLQSTMLASLFPAANLFHHVQRERAHTDGHARLVSVGGEDCSARLRTQIHSHQWKHGARGPELQANAFPDIARVVLQLVAEFVAGFGNGQRTPPEQTKMATLLFFVRAQPHSTASSISWGQKLKSWSIQARPTFSVTPEERARRWRGCGWKAQSVTCQLRRWPASNQRGVSSETRDGRETDVHQLDGPRSPRPFHRKGEAQQPSLTLDALTQIRDEPEGLAFVGREGQIEAEVVLKPLQQFTLINDSSRHLSKRPRSAGREPHPAESRTHQYPWPLDRESQHWRCGSPIPAADCRFFYAQRTRSHTQLNHAGQISNMEERSRPSRYADHRDTV